ncbi:MAG: hypothetical protein HC906_19590, partial [Bacteroidales bacterium]|nr:hypothetical protein [Bacteroidales bacterium]
MQQIKKSYLLVSFSIILSVLTSNAQNGNSAVSYLNSISQEYQRIQKDMWDYTSTIAHSRSARKVDNKRVDLMNTINKSKQNVRALPSFEGDKSLEDSVVAFLTLSYKVLNNDFADIIDMEAVAEQSYDKM